MWPTASSVLEEVVMMRKPQQEWQQQQLMKKRDKVKGVKENKSGTWSKLVSWDWLEF